MQENMTNINISMDTKLMEQAEQLFADLGMSMSTAFQIFVQQSLREGGIPFAMEENVPTAETMAALQEAEQIAHDPSVPGYTDLDALFAELKK